MISRILGYLFLCSSAFHVLSAIWNTYGSSMYFEHMQLGGILFIVAILFDNRSIYEQAARKRHDGSTERFRNTKNRRSNIVGNDKSSEKNEN